MGKASFCSLQDRFGDTDLRAGATISGRGLRPVKKLDIGDIVGIRGLFSKQDRGDLHPHHVADAAFKSCFLAEKWHGLRTRHPLPPALRGLIVNPEVKVAFEKRSGCFLPSAAIWTAGYRNVDPHPHTIPAGDGPAFSPHHNTLDIACICASRRAH
jgi:lysyl-tRNA synthetase class II